VDIAAIDTRLIEGLHGNRWRETLEELLGDEPLDAGGRVYLERLASRFEAFVESAEMVRFEIIGALGAGGVESHPVGAIGPDSTATLRIAKRDRLTARRVLEDHGFIDMYRLGRGAQKALELVNMRMSMVSLGGPLSRVNLCWGTRGDSGVGIKWVTPSLADVRSVELPEGLWWAYWIVRPIRVVRRRMLRVPEDSHRAPFLATPVPLIRRLLDLASPGRDELLVDLGCGDGRVVIEAARRYGCQAVGIEANGDLAGLARGRVEAEGLNGRVVIEHRDLTGFDISKARVIFAFLPAGYLTRLLPSLLGRLPEGARVVVHEQAPVSFTIKPTERELIVHESGLTIGYIWRV
jgi:hypothetical protein